MRIADTFQGLRAKRRKALSLFVTAGYPALADTVPLVLGLEKAGADLIELGIPFSDPIADGPTIQHSSEVALKNGVTLHRTLGLARQIRAESAIPLVLMGYANPIWSYGLDRFLSEAAAIGIDGVIIADLPMEESGPYVSSARKLGLATIFLAAPTTPAARLAELDRVSTGFLYCISITGVTGERTSPSLRPEEFLAEARASVKHNPLLVGFGISTPDDARRIALLSDGIIVGSALIKALGNSSGGNAGAAYALVGSMRKALDDLG